MKIEMSKEQAKDFLDVVKKAKDFIDTISVTVTKDFIEMYGLDSSRVQFIDFKVQKEMFNDYQFDFDSEKSFIVASKDFVAKLNRCNDDTVLEIKEDYMEIKSNKKKYLVKYIDEELGQKPDTTVEWTIDVEVVTADVIEALADVKMNDDTESVNVDFTENQIKFMEKKNVNGDSESVVDNIVENRKFADKKVTLNHKLFSKMMFKKASNMNLKLKDDSAMVVEYNENQVNMFMMLALME